MEPLTLLIGLATIVGTGTLTKVGENIADGAVPKIKELFASIQRKLPHTQTVKSLAAGQDIDEDRAIIDLEPIVEDPEVTRLLAEIRSSVAQNSELLARLEKAMAKIQPKVIQINKDRSQANQFNAPIQNLTINQIPNPD
jgi:hypothetical protein